MLPSRFTNLILLGEGGFARVDAATDASLGSVAVKYPTHLTEPELERFAREVELQCELSHPNIVEVLDFDLDDSPPWYAMPVAACNLAQAAKLVDWEDSTILELFNDVLSGVGHAHGNHVLHRDLKPGNVLVFLIDASPVAKVSDFGLGRRFTRDRMKFQTRTAVGAGTEFYTAPEQWDDLREVNETADVFSLAKILESIISARPSIGQANPQLSDCIRVATRSDPFERYQSVEQFSVAIGLAIANAQQSVSTQDNWTLATQGYIDAPEDSIAVDRLMDALEKLDQIPGSLGVALARLPESAVAALCMQHVGRLRSLLIGIVSVEAGTLLIDAALGVLTFLEACLDVSADENLRGVALLGLVRLASIYDMEEFREPVLYRLYMTSDLSTLGVLRSLLSTEPDNLRWLRLNVDRTKFSFDTEDA